MGVRGVPLQWLAARAALALHPKALRQIGNPRFFITNSGSINEPLMGGSFFCGERGGNRSIGEANLRKGHQPLLWKRPCRPLQWKRPCRPLQWKRSCRLLQWERYCRPPLSTAGRPYSRPARLAAILRLLLLFLNTERNVSRSFILEGGALPRWKFFCCIFIFGGYFCG